MKKTRFIPYGYTMRNGRTVIEHGEADIIRYIFDEYIKGASLKDLAEELTARKVPYTEKRESQESSTTPNTPARKSMIPSSMKIRLRKQRRQKQPDCATKL